jgi:hypothetical protein
MYFSLHRHIHGLVGEEKDAAIIASAECCYTYFVVIATGKMYPPPDHL